MNNISSLLKNKNIKALCFLIVALLLFFISYSIFSKIAIYNDNNYAIKTMKKIIKINDSSKSFLDNSELNVEKALNGLPEIKTKLTDLSSEINSKTSTLSKENKECLDNLSKGLSENILVIEQLEGMLNNPSGKDIDMAIEHLKIYQDSADSYYCLLSKKGKEYNLGTCLYSVINATTDYCLSSNSTKKILDIQTVERNEYLNTLNELVISLDGLIVDYYDKVMDCRSGKITYELLVSEVDSTSAKIDSVKKVLFELKYPDNLSSINASFSEIVNLYSDYLYNLKYAIVTENVRRSSKDIKENFLDSLYESSNDLFNTIEKKHSEFSNDYKSLNCNN